MKHGERTSLTHWGRKLNLDGQPFQAGRDATLVVKTDCARYSKVLLDTIEPSWDRVTCSDCLDLRQVHEVHEE